MCNLTSPSLPTLHPSFPPPFLTPSLLYSLLPPYNPSSLPPSLPSFLSPLSHSSHLSPSSHLSHHLPRFPLPVQVWRYATWKCLSPSSTTVIMMSSSGFVTSAKVASMRRARSPTTDAWPYSSNGILRNIFSQETERKLWHIFCSKVLCIVDCYYTAQSNGY